MTAFDLGRMRHLDLLALWHALHPDAHKDNTIARLSKECLAAAILRSAS